ncbi:MAG TPA: alpha/beta hydrolase [Sphingomicrobium sp.]|nr:alpha/beta hydrolase [Sphingomicrobium sp.]
MAAALAASPAYSSIEALPVRHIPAHDLPVPTTVSPQMQAAIANAPPSVAPTSLPTTNAGWKEASNPDPAKTHSDVLAVLSRLKLKLKETRFGGVHCYLITPEPSSSPPTRLLMYIHGGAYTGGAGESGLMEGLFVAGATRIETVAVDYRMPPDHPFPAPLDDAIAVWKQLSGDYPRAKLGLFGSSTGGAMTLALTQRSISEHLRVPDAVFAGSPWSDLSQTGDSYFSNRYTDPMVYEGGLSVSARQYANGLDLKDPRLSPVYGSFSNFPPTLLLSGTRDLFLSNTVRVAQKLRDADSPTELIVYEGQTHTAYLSGLDYPETQAALRDISSFFRRNLK